ncbi:xylitol oxidase [Jatrophihabitans endophyticus]|uniref:Xylitol oxidase n=1 Tax=Jatrophihabitans endophyticus TaxID=1206085 RepID=A0A1M5H0I2_9ACTN|nr:FAD-binding protein [Jatrophihabitans endophyticus]SHG09529.1 xylitol oxidase [Jatrophihabitans endophyticus]
MTVRNWARNIAFTADEVLRPTSVAELSELVASRALVRALGTGHSFNRIADSTGVLVSTRDLALPIEIDGDTVSVGGGTRYGELAVALHAAGRALANLGSLPHISVAGACATGTHGSGSGNRCLAAAALAVEFVRADGALVRLTRDDPDFGGAVLALGALGIVTRLTLATVPTFEIRQDVWVDAPLPRVLDRLDDVLDSAYSVSLFTSWRRRDVLDQIWTKSRTDGVPFDGAEVGARPAEVAMHPIAGQDGATATPQSGSAGPWHERLPHFRLEFTPSNGEEQQSEYLLPRSAGAAAVAALAEVDFAGALQVCEIRTVAADELWLSPCSGRDTLALHFTWFDDDVRVANAVDALERTLAPFDPRPHWGKVFRAAPTWHRPALPRFRELVDRYDPDRTFGNAFLAEHVY